MPVFSIETPDKRTLDIEAADQAAAIAGAQDWVSKNPLKKAEGPGLAGRLDYLGNELTLGGLDVAQGAIRGLFSGKGISKGIEEERAASRREAEQLGTAEKLAYGAVGALPLVFGGPLTWGAKGAAMAARAVPGAARAGTALAEAAQAAKATMPPALSSAASKLVPQSAVGQGIARGAAEGAAYGGIEGAFRGTGVGEGALAGGALGGALGGVAGKISQALKTPKKDMTPIPTAEELKSASEGAFGRARGGYTLLTPEASDKIRSSMLRQISDLSENPRHLSLSMRSLEDLGQAGTPLTLRNLDTFRESLNEGLSAAGKGVDAKGMVKMSKELMSGMRSLRPSDFSFVSGASADMASALPWSRAADKARRAEERIKSYQEGIDKWGKFKKSSTINSIIDSLQTEGGDYASAVAREFKRLYKNKREMRYYTDAEKEMIRSIASGNPNKRAIDWLGKFAPKGPVSSIAYMLGGKAAIPAAMITGAASVLGKRRATREAQQGISDLLDYVSTGASRATLPVSQARLSAEGYVDPTRRLLTYGLLGQ